MSVSWAYIYEHPGTDPVGDRTVVDRGGQRALLVPVPTAASAADVARTLVEEDGVTLVELCGGFTSADVAQVAGSLPHHVAVGHVTFAADALAAAVAYSGAAAAAIESAGRTG
ncbi:DUF6506 family protein [Georgenia alba]|uniref:DUF6506 family protein n=1 Tax=Georgenia alba TaxID=2233858 RepID=A0ABW2QAX3_9MICO